MSHIISSYLQKNYIKSKSIIISECIRNRGLRIKKGRAIRLFLEQDENSSIYSNKKYFTTKNKIKKRKWFLCNTIDNLFPKFKPHNILNISRSQFYRLEPFWIVHRKITDLDTCLCKPHSNMKFLIEKLYFHKLLQSMSSEKFITSLRCDNKNRLCLYGECIECKNHFVELKINNIPTFYYQWVTRNVHILGAKGLAYHVKITSKVRIDCMLSELVNEINLQIPRYLSHVYDTGHQFHAIENVKLSLKEIEVFMVIDFSQNYMGKYTNAI